ncbi:MAG TPA: serine hydrolase [Candidatus Saccharimonadales bacterium]|nr:serine hydrolase [Candidatus Saccharimonadales bacterium]
MFPFIKKKDDSKDQDKEEVKEKKTRKRRKKAEPPKPWSKRERIIVFMFLVGTFMTSTVLAVRSNQPPALPHPLNETGKVIGKAISRQTFNVDELKNELINKTKSTGGTYGIWAEDLSGAYKLGLNEKMNFNGASLFKLPLLIAYYKEVDEGKIDPNTMYSLKYSDATSGSGNLASLPPGTTLTYRDIVSAMGKNSDNTAFQIIGNIVGWGNVDATIQEIGMTGTSFENGTTTAEDIGLLFSKLAKGGLISNSSKQALIDSLKNTNNENLIPAGIPDTIEVAHKYGAIDGELNDAGIVYSGSPFIIVILGKDKNQNEASQAIAQISEIVYNWTTK